MLYVDTLFILYTLLLLLFIYYYLIINNIFYFYNSYNSNYIIISIIVIKSLNFKIDKYFYFLFFLSFYKFTFLTID